MKAISLWQPWASAIAVGAKRYETRNWPAVCDGQAYSGWLAICAAKKVEDDGEPLRDDFEDLLSASKESFGLFVEAGFGQWQKLPLGAVVAIANLVKCHQTENLEVSPLERLWGNYLSGRFAWEFQEIWRLREPMPIRGKQKIFEIPMPDNWPELCIPVNPKHPSHDLR